MPPEEGEPGPLEPQVVADLTPLETLLPSADFTPEDLNLWRKKKADVMDSLQILAVKDLKDDPALRRSILARQGYAAIETLDRIGRLERGQSTANITIAVFDAQVEKQKARIAELEALREKLKKETEGAQESRASAEESGSKETRMG